MNAQAQITGIKNSFSHNSDQSSSWRDLISVAKNNPVQYTHINSETRSKYFEPNAVILEDALEKTGNFRVCNGCGKPILIEAILDHIQNHCSGANNNLDSSSQNMDSFSESMTNSPNNGNNDFQTKESLKRALESENGDSINSSPGKNAEKKVKSETPGSSKRQRKVKQRNPTDKHLIDFDKQCGVKLPEGGYCARSLTCKSHSMGDKRAVEGRTEPFDTLLAEYHRKHQTKIGAAAEKRAKQQELQKIQKQIQREQKEQKKLAQKENKTDKRKKGTAGGAKGPRGTGAARGKAGTSQNTSNFPILTPEEETTQVLNGVSRSFPLPLESRVLSSVRYRTKYVRMREMFASAFSVKPGYSSPGYGSIHSRVGCVDIDRTTDYKYRIRTPQPVNQSGNQNLTPQQIQKLQQQRLLQSQMMQQKQAQGASLNNLTNNGNNMQTQARPNENISTPQELQQQHLRQQMQQQQIQQQQQRQQQQQPHPSADPSTPNMNSTNHPQNGTDAGSPGSTNLMNSVAIGSPVNNVQSPGVGAVNIGNSVGGRDDISNLQQVGGRVN